MGAITQRDVCRARILLEKLMLLSRIEPQTHFCFKSPRKGARSSIAKDWALRVRTLPEQ